MLASKNSCRIESRQEMKNGTSGYMSSWSVRNICTRANLIISLSRWDSKETILFPEIIHIFVLN
jgi:hypothetical protein